MGWTLGMCVGCQVTTPVQAPSNAVEEAEPPVNAVAVPEYDRSDECPRWTQAGESPAHAHSHHAWQSPYWEEMVQNIGLSDLEGASPGETIRVWSFISRRIHNSVVELHKSDESVTARVVDFKAMGQDVRSREVEVEESLSNFRGTSDLELPCPSS